MKSVHVCVCVWMCLFQPKQGRIQDFPKKKGGGGGGGGLRYKKCVWLCVCGCVCAAFIPA